MSDECKPLVSVVIPSYNYEQSLPLCIQSLLDQTYDNIEIIVVDDHSTDRSYDIASGFPVILLQTEKNGGPAVARNLGVSIAKGDIFFFVDADVELNLDVIEVAVCILGREPDAVAVCGVYDPKPLFVDSVWEEFKSLQAHVWRLSSIGRIATLSTALAAVRREIYQVVGDFNIDLQQTEGIDYGERLARAGRIILTDQMRARHDDDQDLSRIMWKLWRRSQDRVPFYFQKGDVMNTFELPRRLLATALVGLLWSFCFVLLFTTAIWPAIVVLLIGLIWTERDMYVGMIRHLSPFKWPLFLLWYFAFHTTAGLGVCCGLAKFAFSSNFRKMYKDWDLTKPQT